MGEVSIVGMGTIMGTILRLHAYFANARSTASKRRALRIPKECRFPSNLVSISQALQPCFLKNLARLDLKLICDFYETHHCQIVLTALNTADVPPVSVALGFGVRG